MLYYIHEETTKQKRKRLIYMTKQEFVKRVFGGKVNTPKTILAKVISESQKENRYALQCNKSVTKKRFDEMDILIEEHYTWCSKFDF